MIVWETNVQEREKTSAFALKSVISYTLHYIKLNININRHFYIIYHMKLYVIALKW